MRLMESIDEEGGYDWFFLVAFCEWI
jgi:hypothetical protein